MNTSVDNYLLEGCGRCSLGGTPECKVHKWRPVLESLRQIALDCGLTEECKWGLPCYTFQNGNVLIISAFKEYCSINFLKGSLLADRMAMLEKPGESSQATRLVKFRSVGDIQRIETNLKAYIHEAIEIEKAGLKVTFQKNPEPVPEELERKFEEDLAFKSAFEALTPGRQRGYILYFSQPKQSSTRISRIEKCTAMIFNGIGLNDRYKSKGQ